MSDAVVSVLAGLVGVFVGGALNWRVQSALEDRRERAKREEEDQRRRLEAASALRLLRVELEVMHDQLTHARDVTKKGLSQGGGPVEWDRRMQGFTPLDAWRIVGPAVAIVLPDGDWLSLAETYHVSEALRRTLERDPSGEPETTIFRGIPLVTNLLEMAEYDIEHIDRLLPELGAPARRVGSEEASGP
jgi:hypothetical protein